MTLRVAKFALTAGLALYYTLVVLNNLTDYDSNYQFVRHVLMMDSTFAGNHVMWRAIQSPTVHTAFYLSIIVWECVTTALLWMGVVQMVRAPAPERGRVSRGQEMGARRADTRRHDVVGGVFERGRRMVCDVAIQNVERTGCGVSNVLCDGDCFAGGCAARRRGAAVRRCGRKPGFHPP